MRPPTFVILLTALSLQPEPARAQQNRAMTTDDVLDMVAITNPVLSPDGSWVLFGRSELDWEENERKTTWYRVPADGGEPYQFVGEAGGSRFTFSPDGSWLAFTRTVDGTAQLFAMRTGGGEAVQVTEHPTAVSDFKWGPDSRAVYFVADEARAKAEEAEHEKGADAIFVDEGPNGQRADRWTHLWTVDIASRDTARVVRDSIRIGSFDVSPGGDRAVATVRFENRRNQQYRSEIHLIDLSSGRRTRLTENEAPESAVRWAPDGVHVAYSAASDRVWELRQNKLWVMNVDSREYRVVTSEFEGRIGDFWWSPDSRHILFSGLQGTNTNLYRANVASGAIQQVTDVEGRLSVESVSADGRRMAYTFEDFDTPPDLYVSPTDRLRPTRLTQANDSLVRLLALADMQLIRWNSRDGLEIEGLLALPPGHREGQRLPLLLHVHGGPAGVFTNAFRGQHHVWAGLGYAQLLPNVRGSSGYSDDLLRGNMRDIGGGDYWDLMTGVDYVIEEGYADPDQLGIRGWSYGGILGGFTITQTDRFKAASLGAMVSDWTSEYGPGFNHDVRLWYIGGTPWENPEAYRARSALTHVANVTTPTLLLHGINDRTDTEPQSMMFFAALKDQGKATRYIRFPREPHGFREPRHQRTRDVEEIRWIQKYVRGIDWTPWDRPSQADSAKQVTDGSGG